jgi:hypothetical protein
LAMICLLPIGLSGLFGRQDRQMGTERGADSTPCAMGRGEGQ